MAETTRGPGRRVGADSLIDAAVAMLLDADLADLLSFLTFAAVADRSGVRPATVQHHFKRRSENAKTNERLAHAAVLRILGGEEARSTAAIDQAGDAASVLEKRPEATMAVFRQIATTTIEAYLADSHTARVTMLTAAVADSDPTAASILADWYRAFTDDLVPMYETLVDAFDRRFDVDAGFDVRSFAVLITAVTDGLILRSQFEPDAVDAERYGEFVMRMFEAATVEQSAAEVEPVDERLLRRIGAGRDAAAAGSGLDLDKRSAMIAAASALYDQRGSVADLSVAAVARTAGVSRATVVSHFGDVAGLGWAVLSRSLPELERRIQRDHDRGRSPIGVIERHLQRVAEQVSNEPELAALAFEAAVRYRTRHRTSGIDPSDPRMLGPLPHVLVPVIVAHADLFRPGLDQVAAAFDLAATLTDVTVLRALSSASATPSEVVDHVIDVVLEGALRR